MQNNICRRSAWIRRSRKWSRECRRWSEMAASVSPAARRSGWRWPRTLCHRRPLLILDDPFSALDQKTEREIFDKLKQNYPDTAILLISHRLYLFPEMDQVIWMEDGQATVSDHETLMRQIPEYAKLFAEQNGGREYEA